MKLVFLAVDHFCFWLFTGGLLNLCYGDCIDCMTQAENSMVYLLRFLPYEVSFMTREVASGEGVACV